MSPLHDIAVPGLGGKVLRRDMYILQKRTEKWGLVDITNVSQVSAGDEQGLVDVYLLL